jgi:hypothetical protein
MKLEQQVTSLELSKKLKELGVKQESFFYWALRQDVSWICAQGKGWSDSVSAFTVAELGEMLPEEYVLPYRMDSDNGRWRCYPIEDDEDLFLAEADIEADARAKMLVYLLENKLITNLTEK